MPVSSATARNPVMAEKQSTSVCVFLRANLSIGQLPTGGTPMSARHPLIHGPTAADASSMGGIISGIGLIGDRRKEHGKHPGCLSHRADNHAVQTVSYPSISI